MLAPRKETKKENAKGVKMQRDKNEKLREELSKKEDENSYLGLGDDSTGSQRQKQGSKT